MKPRSKIRVPKRGMASHLNADFESMWTVMASSLREILTKNASNLSFEELYRTTYQLVLLGRGTVFYERVCELEKDWLKKDVEPSVAAFITPNLLVGDEVFAPDQVNERREAGERFLNKMREAWEDHQLCVGMITDVLMYMDRVMYNEHRRPPIYTTGMGLFRDFVLRSKFAADSDQTIASVFESTLLFMVRLEREGTMIDRSLLRHSVYLLDGLYESETDSDPGNLYFTTFEPAFLDSSRTFYLEEGQHLLTTADAPTFCKRVAARIEEEGQRCSFALVPATGWKIEKVLDEVLVKRNISEAIAMEDSGVKHMLDNDRILDLANVYNLIARIDSKKTDLTRAVQARVVELGEKINLAAKELVQPRPSQGAQDNGKGKAATDNKPPINLQTAAAVKWVDEVLQLKVRFDEVWAKAFDRDQVMQTALTNSFGDFINTNSRSAEYLSLFFDENLKKGIKGKSEEEIDGLLDNGITLLRYIRDKDLFETYYKKHLSRRLLMKRSASMDAERQIISKMKMEVGKTFTQRLEAMFRDMTISNDLTTSYRDHINSQSDPGEKKIDLEMRVLTSTMWPMDIMSNAKDGATMPKCILPREVEKVRESFEAFYLGKHTGRKLSWQPSLGTADIRATFVRPSGKVVRHELNVSTYAMVILLLFNNLPTGECLSYEEIQAKTNIPTNDLVRNLQSLAVAPKTRVLKKEPMSKDIKPTDRFYYNDEFQSNYTKVKIGVVSSGANKVENKDERTETERKTNEERGGNIEAAIVRIMKQRKKLPHSQLLTEVISQLASRFMPDVHMVKRRIESLLDREYLERIPDSDPPSYGYLA